MLHHSARMLRAIVFAAGIAAGSGSAVAASSLTNFTDLWWNPAEPGWGLNVSQQADTMFLTFYVYASDGRPIWYTALVVDQGPQPDGSTLFAGNLFQSQGSYYGGPFEPGDFATASIGSATFRATSTTNATLSYVAGGVSVSKSIERFTLRSDDFSGSYLGGTSDITSNCSVPNNNNFRSEEHGVFTVTHVGTLMEIRSPTCTYTGQGTFRQIGQTGRLDAVYSCTNGASGELTFFDLRVEPGGITGRYRGRGSSCDFDGNIGLARRK